MNKTRSGKRGATSDLNHENWDAEEEEEDRGLFQAAPADVISKRKIKVAKRRVTGSEAAGTGGLFKSFTAFGSSSTSASTSTANSAGATASTTFPAFSFGSQNNKPGDGTEPFTFLANKGNDARTDEKKSSPPSKMKFGATPYGFKPLSTHFTFGSSTSSASTTSTTESGEKNKKEDGDEKLSSRDQHLHSLRDLNISVNKWISSHVEKNPYCDLTPVFADYEKHLKEIEKKHPYEEEAEAEKSSVPKPIDVIRKNGDGTSSKPPTVLPNFGLSAAAVEAAVESSDDEHSEDDSKDKESDSQTAAKSSVSPFSFGQTKNEDKAGSSEKESVGESTSAKSSALGFSFGVPAKSQENSSDSKETTAGEKKPAGPSLFTGINFSFSTTSTITKPTFPFTGLSSWSGTSLGSAPSTMTSKPEGEEDEEYVPPKAEVREIKEEGSVLTKRCKLYYKWEDAWQDKGVGNLHLKPLEDGKVQFLIRADTNLGNILLNVMLTSAIPVSRTKTNITLICVPSPPMRPQSKSNDSTPEPMPLLVRLKTEAEAEAVLEKLNELRKKE